MTDLGSCIHILATYLTQSRVEFDEKGAIERIFATNRVL
jgi:hypothetical protein